MRQSMGLAAIARWIATPSARNDVVGGGLVVSGVVPPPSLRGAQRRGNPWASQSSPAGLPRLRLAMTLWVESGSEWRCSHSVIARSAATWQSMVFLVGQK